MQSDAKHERLIPEGPCGQPEEPFPSAREAKEPSGCLLLAYARFVFRYVPNVAWRSVVVAVLEQLYCLFYYFCIIISVYVADVVLNEADDDTVEKLLVADDRRGTLWLCAALFAAAGLLLLLVWQGCGWLKGRILCDIAEYHAAQLLEAAATSRGKLSSETALGILAIVEKGYLTFFPLFVLAGLINVNAVFMLNVRPETVVGLVFYLVFVLCLAWGCGPTQEHLESEEGEAAGGVGSACQDLSAVRREDQRRAVAMGSLKKFEALCEARSERRRFRLCSKPLLWAPTVVAVAVDAAYGAQQVLAGTLTLKQYMDSQSEFFLIGFLFYLVYTTLCERAESVAPLAALVHSLSDGTADEDEVVSEEG